MALGEIILTKAGHKSIYDTGLENRDSKEHKNLL